MHSDISERKLIHPTKGTIMSQKEKVYSAALLTDGCMHTVVLEQVSLSVTSGHGANVFFFFFFLMCK